MVRKIDLLLILVLVLSFSCRSDVNDQRIVSDRYGDGTFKKVLHIDVGTDKVTSYIYYPTGRIQSITQLNDTIKDGTEILFWENGDTAGVHYYNNGLLDGDQRWFEKNCLISIARYKSGIPIDEKYHYYINGVIGKYFFYNKDGILLYQAIFDEYGRFLRDSGRAFVYAYIKSNDTPLERGDTVSTGDTVNVVSSLVKNDFRNYSARLQFGTIDTSDKFFYLEDIPINYYPHNEYKIVLDSSGWLNFALYLEGKKSGDSLGCVNIYKFHPLFVKD